MTTQDFNTIATAKLSKLSTSELVSEVKKLSNDFSDSASMVFDIALKVLMERLEESEFIQLCNSL